MLFRSRRHGEVVHGCDQPGLGHRSQQYQASDRHHHGATHPLEKARKDELREGGRGRAAQGPCHESHHGGGEHRPRTEPIGHPAADGNENRQADQIGGNVTNNTVVTLVLPEVTMGKFIVDINNQVVQAGNQTLVTMSSGSIAPLASSVLPASTLSAVPAPTNTNNTIQHTNERNSTHEYLNKNSQDFPVPADIA